MVAVREVRQRPRRESRPGLPSVVDGSGGMPFSSESRLGGCKREECFEVVLVLGHNPFSEIGSGCVVPPMNSAFAQTLRYHEANRGLSRAARSA